MSRRPATGQVEAPGQDSFLDVVANLVGILIILVMVVGMRAREAFTNKERQRQAAAAVASPAPGAPPASTALAAPAADERAMQLRAAREESSSLARDLEELEARLASEAAIGELRRRERDQAQTLVVALEQELASAREGLDGDAQSEYDLRAALVSARRELEEVEQARVAAAAEQAEPTVLLHEPTPLAQTVYGEELNFRLLRGRLAAVPLEEFVRELKQEAPHKIWKLKDAPQITETLGPRRGFRMQYTLKLVKRRVSLPSGDALATAAELDHFVLLPQSDQLGEPVEQALTTASDFRAELAGRDPRNTTVTLWVYPDSFAEFRRVKGDLEQQGFRVAARPLPADQPIGGAPSGARSAAQ